MGAGKRARADGLADGVVRRRDCVDIDLGQLLAERLAAQLGELAGEQGSSEGAHERDLVSRARKAQAPGPACVGQAAEHSDDGGRVDGAGGTLVVERDVAADDRRLQSAAGLAQAADGFAQLPGDVRLLRVAEVEVVGRAERLGADAGEVGGALEHRCDRAAVGVGGDAAAVAVDAHGQGGPGPPAGAAGREREHRCVGLLGAADGARLDDCVVLLEQRPARGEVGARQQREQRLVERGRGVEAGGGGRVDRPRRRLRIEVIQRALLDEGGDRHVAHGLPVAQHADPPAVGDGADGRAADLPLLADGQRVLEVVGLEDAEHALLRLADHHLEGLHAGLAQRHLGDVDVDPHAALGGHLGCRGGQPGGAEVLQRHEQPALEQLQ